MLSKLFKFDWILITVSLLLLSVGLLALYSISTANQPNGYNIFTKQLFFAALGMGLMFFLAFTDYHYLKSYSPAIFLITLLVLGAVLLWGESVRGTSGWIGIGPFNVQPVEMAKLALIISLASFISRKKMGVEIAGKTIYSFTLAAAMIFLVIKQPDFGSAMVLAGIWLGMVIVSGISRKLFVVVLLAVAVSVSCSWFLLADFQKARVTNLIKPGLDPQGSGYNVIQSEIAIGSGGILGKGIGHGSQSQLNFLPEKHTDFIFAVITEEMGMLGAFFVLSLFSVLFYRIKKTAAAAADNFGCLLASGIMIMFFLQVVVNIGMNIGIVPVTGIPLPFLSYGGSSLIAFFISLGILNNIYLNKKL